MSNSVEQTQKGGDESTNVQAGQVVIHQHALTYSDVKEIALDVFKNNFDLLSKVARETARTRAEEITDEFLVELRERNPAGLNKAETPQFQLNLLTLQREFVRTGDKDLGKLLVDLLIDVTKQDSRTVLQIVLEECLTVAPKLTGQQVGALAAIFLFRYCMQTGMHSPESFREYCQFALPFIESLSKTETTYRHLEYSGCGSISMGAMRLESALRNIYPILFSRPFTTEELQQAVPELVRSNLVIRSPFQEGAFQFRFSSEGDLEKAVATAGFDSAVWTKAKNFLNGRQLPDEQVRAKAVEWVPQLNALFEIWDNSSMQNFNLTSVGLGIAHAAVRSKTGFHTNLSTWVN
jgi:hypothetical protein